MNKIVEREELKMPPFSASKDSNPTSIVTSADAGSPEEQLATDEKSYPRRSSVVEMWRKREASTKSVNTKTSFTVNSKGLASGGKSGGGTGVGGRGALKFEEKKEMHGDEDEPERDSVTSEKRSTLHLGARTVTPERNGPEPPFISPRTPTISEDTATSTTSTSTYSSTKRSNVRESWKKRNPNIPPSGPSSSLSPSTAPASATAVATPSPMVSESPYASIPPIPQNDSGKKEVESPGGRESPAGLYTAVANRTPTMRSVWRNSVSYPSTESTGEAQPQTEQTKERSDGTRALHGTTPTSPPISTIERTNSHASYNSATIENPASNNNVGTSFDELRLKWAKFGIQQQQQGSVRDSAPRVSRSSPIPSSPRPYGTFPKAAGDITPRVATPTPSATTPVNDTKSYVVNTTNHEVGPTKPAVNDVKPAVNDTPTPRATTPVNDTKPHVNTTKYEVGPTKPAVNDVKKAVNDTQPMLQSPERATDLPATPGSSKAPGFPLPKRIPMSAHRVEHSKSFEQFTPSRKKHFVKKGQLHTSRPKVESPILTSHSPMLQTQRKMHMDALNRLQSPKSVSTFDPVSDPTYQVIDNTIESVDSADVTMSRDAGQAQSPESPSDFTFTRLAVKKLSGTKGLRAKHRRRAADRSAEMNDSDDVTLPLSKTTSASESIDLDPHPVQPSNAPVSLANYRSQGLAPMATSEDVATRGFDTAINSNEEPNISKDSLFLDLDTTGDSARNVEPTEEGIDDMLRTSLPMQTLFGGLSEEIGSGDEQARAVLFSNSAQPGFSPSVSNSNSFGFPGLTNEQAGEATTTAQKSFDSWHGNPSFSVDDRSASALDSTMKSPIATSLTNKASQRLRDRRQRPLDSRTNDIVQQPRRQDIAPVPAPVPFPLAPPPAEEDRSTQSLYSEHVPAMRQLPTATKRYDAEGTQRDANVGSHANTSVDESIRRNRSIGSETSCTYSNSQMQTTFGSGFSSDDTNPRERARRGLARSLPAVPLAKDLVPDEFVSEKNASVESFKIAYERLSFDQIARDIREEASSVLNIDFLNKGMYAAGESINKIVGGEVFQPSRKKSHRRAPSPVEDVAIEVEYIADSDDEYGR